MVKLIDFNSFEKEVLTEYFKTIPMIDIWLVTLIENYIYSSIKTYFNNGVLDEEYRTKFGVKDGEYKCWHENLQLHLQTSYIDGKCNGEHKIWHENGQLYVQTTYLNDKEHGEFKMWFENGKICKDCNYVYGKLNGEYKYWFNNGQIFERYTYVDGKIHVE